MLKKIIAVVLTMATVIATPHVAIAKTTHKTSYRTAFAVCVDVSVKDDIAYMQTGDGNYWATECNDADVGDVYKIVFDTHRTREVTDDSIYSVRYIGYVFNVKNINK